MPKIKKQQNINIDEFLIIVENMKVAQRNFEQMQKSLKEINISIQALKLKIFIMENWLWGLKAPEKFEELKKKYSEVNKNETNGIG